MHFMKSVESNRTLDVSAVSAQAQSDATSLIAAEEARYRREIGTVADRILAHDTHRHIVLLSGPSSSGKTTTAAYLQTLLGERGVAAHVVSLDDFYLGRGRAPRLPDGSFDYETIDALDVDRLLCCMRELIQIGKTQMPIFDFHDGKPAQETRTLQLEEHAAVIFEGIHAFNPRLQTCLPDDMVNRVFINTLSRFENEGERWLARRDIRLCRRILRDDQFRNSPFDNTMTMWPQVVRGENLYLFPFAEIADCVIDTTLAFEPCILKDMLLSRLQKVNENSAYADVAQYLTERLSAFPSLPLTMLPKDSLLREFTGQ